MSKSEPLGSENPRGRTFLRSCMRAHSSRCSRLKWMPVLKEHSRHATAKLEMSHWSPLFSFPQAGIGLGCGCLQTVCGKICMNLEVDKLRARTQLPFYFFFVFKKILKKFKYIRVSWMYIMCTMCICVWCLKRPSDPLELELEMWVLGTKPGSL